MKAVVTIAALLAGALLSLPSAAAETGPPPPAEIDLEPSLPDSEELEGPELVAQANVQLAGKLVLATAFAAMIAGVVLIEVDPYALKIGDWGFGMVGVGVSALIASSFMLGLTHPVHVQDHPLERERRRNRNADGSAVGLTLGYRQAF